MGRKAGVLSPIESLSTLPAGFKGENSTAEVVVHPNGKFVYGSNRGHDSIAVFRVEPATGKLTFVEHVPDAGHEPRELRHRPDRQAYLFAANQDTDNVVIFKVDPATGKLTPTGQQMKVAIAGVRPVSGRAVAQPQSEVRGTKIRCAGANSDCCAIEEERSSRRRTWPVPGRLHAPGTDSREN